MPEASPSAQGFSISLAALVITNLVPLAGVLFLGWDTTAIVLLYWIENIIIGFYNLLKMAFLDSEFPASIFSKIFTMCFFTIHFGGFCAVHGIFLTQLLHTGASNWAPAPGGMWLGPLIFVQLLFSVIGGVWQHHPAAIEIPTGLLFISHGISFVQNYLIGKENTRFTLQELMNQPYKRIVVMHIAILAGAALILKTGSPMSLLCLLVLLKTVTEFRLYTKRHANTDNAESV